MNMQPTSSLFFIRIIIPYSVIKATARDRYSNTNNLLPAIKTDMTSLAIDLNIRIGKESS